MNGDALFNIVMIAKRSVFFASTASFLIIFLSQCLMLEDNGAKCWYEIIPIYNVYTHFRVFWDKKYFWFYFIFSILGFTAFIGAIVFCISTAINATMVFGQQMPQTAMLDKVLETLWYPATALIVCLAIFFIFVVISGVFEILLTYNISKTYQYDGAFTVGLILLPIVFYAILGVKCFMKGVFSRIPTGRKIFMLVIVLLTIAFSFVYFNYNLTDAAIANDMRGILSQVK